MRQTTRFAAFRLGLLGACVALLALGGCGKRGTKLTGSGSTFVQPMMGKWVEVYTKEKGGSINYQGTGSGNGVKSMIDKSVDFGCTDAFLNKEQLESAEKAGGAVVHVPVVMGGIVPAYNLPGVDKPLNFTGEVLADIYLNKITNWNDPRIAAVNDGVKLPDQKISVVVRSDGSGSTNIFTDYLSKVSADFKSKVGVGTAVKWPNATGEKGTAGVAGAVSKGPGSIGYVELTYALENKIKFGAVRNKEGKFVLASPEGVSKAAASLADKDIPDDLRFTMTDAPGAESYPISGTTWAVLYVKQPPESGKPLVDFFTWVVHDGQKYAADLHYAPVPANVVAKADKLLQTVGK